MQIFNNVDKQLDYLTNFGALSVLYSDALEPDFKAEGYCTVLHMFLTGTTYSLKITTDNNGEFVVTLHDPLADYEELCMCAELLRALQHASLMCYASTWSKEI